MSNTDINSNNKIYYSTSQNNHIDMSIGDSQLKLYTSDISNSDEDVIAPSLYIYILSFSKQQQN